MILIGLQRMHEDIAQEESRGRWIRRECDRGKLDFEEFFQAKRLHPDAATHIAGHKGDGLRGKRTLKAYLDARSF